MSTSSLPKVTLRYTLFLPMVAVSSTPSLPILTLPSLPILTLPSTPLFPTVVVWYTHSLPTVTPRTTPLLPSVDVWSTPYLLLLFVPFVTDQIRLEI